MKRPGVFLLVIWFFISACGAFDAIKPTIQPSAVVLSKAGTPLPVSSPSPSPVSPEIVASSPTPNPTSTDTPQPSPTQLPSGIEPENLSSLTRLHVFVPFSLNSLGKLVPNTGPGGNISSILSSMFPPFYLAVALSPDGLTLALGGCTEMTGGVGYACLPPGQPILRLMNAQNGEIIRELPGHTSSITGLVFSRDGKTLVSASEASDGSIRFWDVSSGSLQRTLQINSKTGAPALGISPDGSLLAAAWAENFRVWDFASGKIVTQGVSSNGIPRFSKDGSLMAVYGASDRSSIVVYTTASWQPAMKIKLPAQTEQFALSPDGKMLVTGGDNNAGVLHFWDVSTGQELSHAEDNLVPSQIAFTPDGRLLVTGGLPWNSKSSIPLKVMSIWDPATRQKVSDVVAPAVTPLTLVISADGQQIVYAEPGGTVDVWGLPDDQITMAKQVLLAYLDDLNQGNYTAAAGLYYSDRIDPNSPDFQFLQKSHPQLDLNNIATVLQTLCEDKRFPCAKFRDIVFQGELNGEGISFYVEFAAPDGSALVSPIPCSQVASTCEPTKAFLFNLIKNGSGEYKLASLPPSAEFP
jgi:WD40 repeat protein